MAKKSAHVQSVRDVLRIDPEAVDLSAVDPAGSPVGPKSKSDAAEDLAGMAAELDQLQENLYAEGVLGGKRRVLVVLQGMDTSGKGGTIRHVAGLVNPQGLRIVSFKKPTRSELSHDFLWRIRRQLPTPGEIGFFDRSHYEDVLVPRVDKLVPPSVWRARYQQINDFEAELAESGVTILKCFLHISPERQKERLVARLETPEKRWKYNPQDLAVRAKWSQYQLAYTDLLTKCSPPTAPWYAVPSDRKWYRNWAVARLLLHTLRDLAPTYPVPDYDPVAELATLTEADPLR
ncbi:PPK2 family polyphosphate kinase [Umezawaea tangerina]|uniref:PPK2 family polyphosphate:nucleotide phosphotransferase n=1 Tax=Umezawaea tangerina TaxID=84725 RepID=A0A2T0SBZ1_9PSEU|nr:PPK2 family polyphosphate kinase [Umezawaea tangerina]PRY30949.1 PPK2 family polyphosphate:nucleotide phosphotransferase [Umezawaea tangerina]